MIKTSVSSILLILIASISLAGQIIHERFDTKDSAIREGCRIETLKSKDQQSCVVSTFAGHDLILTIYDSTPEGKCEIAERLEITSWYNRAKVDYQDLLGDGRKFIRVEFEGNTGTGTLQMILMYLGWKDGRFVPVFMETKSTHYEHQFLRMDYRIRNAASRRISFDLEYGYEEQTTKGKIRKKWRDVLRWNERSFSFYDVKSEQEKLGKAKSFVSRKISEVRVRLVGASVDARHIDIDTLTRIGIMEILGEDADT